MALNHLLVRLVAMAAVFVVAFSLAEAEEREDKCVDECVEHDCFYVAHIENPDHDPNDPNSHAGWDDVFVSFGVNAGVKYAWDDSAWTIRPSGGFFNNKQHIFVDLLDQGSKDCPSDPSSPCTASSCSGFSSDLIPFEVGECDDGGA